MNSYISMLDFTSVPAWIILYCLTAGDCFSCLSANLFLSGILHCVFSGSRHGSFGAPYTWLPLRGKVCFEIVLYGSLHGLNVVGLTGIFLVGLLQIFLQSVLSGYFNVGLSSSAFLQLGMLVLRQCSTSAWLSSGAGGRLCRAALAADAGAAANRK